MFSYTNFINFLEIDEEAYDTIRDNIIIFRDIDELWKIEIEPTTMKFLRCERYNEADEIMELYLNENDNLKIISFISDCVVKEELIEF
jgi:hypothetical protein